MELNKKCFFITPIGNENSEERQKMTELIKSLTPVLKQRGFTFKCASELTNAGSITKDIINCLSTYDLVIANLTGLNPNVMYELGVRRGVKEPAILIAENDTNLPFDIADIRVIFYQHTVSGIIELKEKLPQFIDKIFKRSIGSFFLPKPDI
ncbi:MAG: hypothetical protein LBK94_06475 [Prevotellaceae bacterium]|jgi:hypothetical protein|nr:hypothetical protein [Prevotellaceae bacterium]